MSDEKQQYTGCEGPESMYVKLISSDGYEFIVKREHALTSGTIKAMLSGPGTYVLRLSYSHSTVVAFFKFHYTLVL